MNYEYLDLKYEGYVAAITLDRPEKRNALSLALRAELVSCLKDLESNEDIKVVIITGRGSVFCAGFDLSELNIDRGEVEPSVDFDPAYHRAIEDFTKKYKI